MSVVGTQAKLLAALRATTAPLSRHDLIAAAYADRPLGPPKSAWVAVGVHLWRLRNKGFAIVGKPWGGVWIERDTDGKEMKGEPRTKGHKRPRTARRCLSCRSVFQTTEDYRMCQPCRVEAAGVNATLVA